MTSECFLKHVGHKCPPEALGASGNTSHPAVTICQSLGEKLMPLAARVGSGVYTSAVVMELGTYWTTQTSKRMKLLVMHCKSH